jgi:catechol 2,3-dioxygenase-like lactoylglutathione lyase family enzyme
VGYGSYRDATFFALELSPTPTEQEVTSNVVSYFGISMLPPGSTLPSSSNAQPQEGSEANARSAADRFAAFMEDRKRRTPPAGTMPLSSSEATGIDVRIVPSSPGDTFARIALSVPDPDLTARFYRDVLGMQEVFRSETEVCVRYTPNATAPAETKDAKASWGGLGGPDGGVPTTLVLTLEPAAGGGASNGKVEAFDHLAVGCVSVDAAYAFIGAACFTSKKVLALLVQKYRY